MLEEKLLSPLFEGYKLDKCKTVKSIFLPNNVCSYSFDGEKQRYQSFAMLIQHNHLVMNQKHSKESLFYYFDDEDQICRIIHDSDGIQANTLLSISAFVKRGKLKSAIAVGDNLLVVFLGDSIALIDFSMNEPVVLFRSEPFEVREFVLLDASFADNTLRILLCETGETFRVLLYQKTIDNTDNSMQMLAVIYSDTRPLGAKITDEGFFVISEEPFRKQIEKDSKNDIFVVPVKPKNVCDYNDEDFAEDDESFVINTVFVANDEAKLDIKRLEYGYFGNSNSLDQIMVKSSLDVAVLELNTNKHILSFPALAYVKSAKPKAIFTGVTEDLSFAFIIESSIMFVYENNIQSDNPKTLTHSKQWIVEIEGTACGWASRGSTIYVLSCTRFYVIDVNKQVQDSSIILESENKK